MTIFTEFNAAAYWENKSDGRIKARYVSPFAIILCTPKGEYPLIGEGTWIGHFCVIDGTYGLTIGKNCDISCGVQIYTHTTHKRCTEGKQKEGAVVAIGDHVFIGPNSVIGMGSTVEDRVVVPALTFVHPFTVIRKPERIFHDDE